MGKLTDLTFWSERLNELARMAPPLGETIDTDIAARIREISCSALSDLLQDPEFPQDLATVLAQAQAVDAERIAALAGAEFIAFLDEFMQLENKILRDAGVDSVAARDLEAEVRATGRGPFHSRVDRLEDKIGFLQRLACSRDAAEDPKRPLWKAAWRAAKGVGLIGLDAGGAAAAAIVLSPAGGAAVGTVAGISASYGAAMVHEAVRGRW